VGVPFEFSGSTIKKTATKLIAAVDLSLIVEI